MCAPFSCRSRWERSRAQLGPETAQRRPKLKSSFQFHPISPSQYPMICNSASGPEIGLPCRISAGSEARSLARKHYFITEGRSFPDLPRFQKAKRSRIVRLATCTQTGSGYAIVLPGRRSVFRSSGTDLGRILVGTASPSARRPTFGRPEGRF